MIPPFDEALRAGDDLSLTSPAFEDGSGMPDWTGFVNENENPPLAFEGVPDGAESLVVTMVHPGAAEVVHHPWIHWTAWGIDADMGTIPRDWDGDGATRGYNDFLRHGYGGPSPPPESTATYHVRVYAIDAVPSLPPETRLQRVASTVGLEANVLGAAELTGTYDASQGTVFATEGPRGLRP